MLPRPFSFFFRKTLDSKIHWLTPFPLFPLWWVWLCGWLFFLWNPPWAGWVMVVYATFANFPRIIAQRYNRIRLRRCLPS
jgi:hypothetical protein